MKRVLTVLAFSLLLVGWTSPVNAAPGWFNAKVIFAGVTDSGSMYIRLTDLATVKAFENKSFFFPAAVRNQMLAISLSALAANLSIKVNTDPDEVGTPLIRVMYLQDQ